MTTHTTKRYVRTGIKRGIVVTVFRKRHRPICYLIRHAKFVCLSDGSAEDRAESDGESGGGAAEEKRSDGSAGGSKTEERGQSKGDGVEDGESETSSRRSDEESCRDGEEEKRACTTLCGDSSDGDETNYDDDWERVRQDIIAATINGVNEVSCDGGLPKLDAI